MATFPVLTKCWSSSLNLLLEVVGTRNVTATTCRSLSTTSSLSKRTPHTIGVMSWIRAGRRRKFLEQKMKENSKSDHQIVKEEKLLRMEPEIEFRTTSRVKDNLNVDVMHRQLVKPEIFLSKDQQTIICYHPPPKPYPVDFTKRAIGPDLFGIHERILERFKDAMTTDEVKEALELRSEDPRVWNTKSLSILFQVKPDAITEQAPLTNEQIDISNAERELYEGMSLTKRKRFRELQQWERLKYIRVTRDHKFTEWYRNFHKKPGVKAPVPPKF